MWNSALANLATQYPSAVLTTVGVDGFPNSLRCLPQRDTAAGHFLIPFSTEDAPVQPGPAFLLFHRHDEKLEGQHQLLVRGRITLEDHNIAFTPIAWVTANGRGDSDEMPHAGAPLHLLQFMLLGRRQAARYLAGRALPWPRVDFKMLVNALRP